jgi:hypothetical protein
MNDTAVQPGTHMHDMPVIDVVATGIAMGFVHVLTGPDHLSALCTMAVGTGAWSGACLGARWGVGHSLGLVVMTVLFLCFEFDPDTIAEYAEPFVGVCMLMLGLWGFWNAYQSAKGYSAKKALTFTNLEVDEEYLKENNKDLENEIEMKSSQQSKLETHLQNHSGAEFDTVQQGHGFARNIDGDILARTCMNRHTAEDEVDQDKPASTEAISSILHRSGDEATTDTPINERKRQCCARFLALGIGLVHGAAG